MLPLTVRRVASAAAQSSTTSLFTTAAAAAAAHTPTVVATSLSVSEPKGRFHQRRYSSSKPSSPKNRSNGPKGLPAGEAVSASSSGEVKTPAEKRKRKSKASDSASDPFQGFPSVPSTQHLSQEALGLSSFFSMHRPISITHSLPRTITDNAFAEIFSPRSGSNKTTEVISTLSRAVDDLEGPMAKMTISREDQPDPADEGMQKIDLKHPDGRESSVFVQIKSMTGQFLPFQPPPIPEPGAAGPAANASAEADLDIAPQHRVYRAMFTIEETMDADGQVQVLAHSPKILGDESGLGGAPPARYIDRLRRMRYEDALQRREVLHAISVKKRRKLRMKKKKFKKKHKALRKLRERLHKL